MIPSVQWKSIRVRRKPPWTMRALLTHRRNEGQRRCYGYPSRNRRSFGGKDTGTRLVYDDDPDRLIGRMAGVYTAEHYKHPSCFCHESESAG